MAVLKDSYLEMYGSVMLERSYCPHCQGMTIVKNDTYVCCGKPIKDIGNIYYSRSAETGPRHKPTRRERFEILKAQDYCCFYCHQEFHSVHTHHAKPLKLKIHWDHRIPYAYSGDNQASNFVAACQVCNGIKSAHIFTTAEEAQSFLAKRRRQLGYDF